MFHMLKPGTVIFILLRLNIGPCMLCLNIIKGFNNDVFSGIVSLNLIRKHYTQIATSVTSVIPVIYTRRINCSDSKTLVCLSRGWLRLSSSVKDNYFLGVNVQAINPHDFFVLSSFRSAGVVAELDK